MYEKKWHKCLLRVSGKGAFLIPALAMLLIFTMLPFFFSLFLSFTKVSLVGGLKITWAGFYNWVQLANDARFWNSLRNTIFIAGVVVSLEYGLGLILALFLNREGLKGRGFFRVAFLIPMMLTPIGIGFMWRMLFDPGGGPVNDILIRLGFPFIGWLSNAKIAIYTIIVSDIWHWTPFMFILLLASLQGIPSELMEAAKVDGASGWQTFRFIIFPLLMPVSVALILLRSIEAFKIMDKVYIITGGGPGTSTETTTLYTYITGLKRFELGYGSTMAYTFFLFILGIAIAFLFIARKNLQKGIA